MARSRAAASRESSMKPRAAPVPRKSWAARSSAERCLVLATRASSSLARRRNRTRSCCRRRSRSGAERGWIGAMTTSLAALRETYLTTGELLHRSRKAQQEPPGFLAYHAGPPTRRSSGRDSPSNRPGPESDPRPGTRLENLMRHPLGIIALGTLLTAPITAGEGPWLADFDEAVEAAREQDKDLFVDFTGSDWCGWCIRLDEEVFAHEEFLTAAQEQYVLVKLDYPRSDEVKALVPNPRRNEELSSRYNISGFPTVLLMTADGDVFGQTGYQAGGPEAYVEHMGTLRSEGRPALQEVIDLAEAFEASEGDERLVMLGKVLDTLEESRSKKALETLVSRGALGGGAHSRL